MTLNNSTTSDPRRSHNNSSSSSRWVDIEIEEEREKKNLRVIIQITKTKIFSALKIKNYFSATKIRLHNITVSHEKQTNRSLSSKIFFSAFFFCSK